MFFKNVYKQIKILLEMNFKEWAVVIKDNKNKIFFALILLIVATLFDFAAGDYLTDHAGSYVSVSDLILNNFGPYDLSFIFVWLFIIVIAIFFLYPLVFNPKKLHYSISMFSFLLIVRSVFIMFTHLRVPSDAIAVSFPSIIQFLNFQNDLFFSGHVGVSFLGFLVFRNENKILSYFMLASSIILGVVVLLMHVHYSIDVFSAFFITYGVYVIGNKLIKR